MRLFLTGFAQVFFVAINTFFITKHFYVGALVCGFLISLIWCFNVKKIAFGGISDKLIYATGAALGSVGGLAASIEFFKLIS